MRKTLLILAIGSLLAALGDATAADPPPIGYNPNPVIWGGQPTRPAVPAPSPGRITQNIHYYYPPVRSFYYGTGCPCYGYWNDYSYPAYYPYLPPLYVSADGLYGPRVVQQLMGVDQRPTVNLIVPPTREDDAPEPRSVERGTNAQSNALAGKFIGFGDAQFAKKKFGEANDRYRKAAQIAPQLADAWFRQGFALAALGRHDQAVAIIKRGLKIAPNWPKSDFRLKDIYGDDALAKNAHLDALAAAAEANRNDANALFMIGVYLHFDGQAARAATFLERARELAGEDTEHIRLFLTK
jgi:tetratricopeptide (TPR) repeat protein